MAQTDRKSSVSLVFYLAQELHNCSDIVRLLSLIFVLACATEPVGSASQGLESGSHLVHSQRVWASPSGTDGVPRYTLAWESLDGTRAPAGVGVVLHATEWMGGALYVDPERVLRYEGERIAAEVIDAPTVSPDGSRFAYVVVEDDAAGTHAALHVSDGSSDVVWDRSLLGFGALRFSPDGSAVLGVGSVNGGVAGLHVVTVEGARCLTNCGLRVGQAWEGFVPPPGSGSALIFEGDHVAFDSPQGRVSEVWR